MEDSLVCPKCGGDNLHHRTVLTHHRETEDSAGIEVLVSHEGVTGRHIDADSPLFAGRRNDLVIEFTCERCDDPTADPPVVFLLRIMQHKGRTLVEWMAGT
jgi:hypothetical protein